MKKYIVTGIIGILLLIYGIYDYSNDVSAGAPIGPEWAWYLPGILLIIVSILGIFRLRMKND